MNISIFLIAIIWAYLYNSFFGWNWNSQSFEELICDGIFAILVSLSILKQAYQPSVCIEVWRINKIITKRKFKGLENVRK